jgi:signal peptidase
MGNSSGVPEVFGKSLITISTDSMEPNIKQHALVLLDRLEPGEIYDLQPGQIITYRSPIDLNGDGEKGDINTHRIVENNTENFYFVTKGDNNKLKDNEGDNPYTVQYTDVLGVCTEDDALNGVGGIISFLQSSLGFFICIVLPLILFFLYELYRFIFIVVTEKNNRNQEKAAETEEEIKKRAIAEYLAQQAAANAANATPTEEKAPEEEASKEEAPAEESASDEGKA